MFVMNMLTDLTDTTMSKYTKKSGVIQHFLVVHVHVHRPRFSPSIFFLLLKKVQLDKTHIFEASGRKNKASEALLA